MGERLEATWSLQQKNRRISERLWKRKYRRISGLDEAGVSNCEIVERGFSPEGRPPVLPVETKRQRVNMLSTVSSQGKVRFMIYPDTMNQQRLIRFMERLIRVSKQKVFLILDNLKVHHGKLAAAWLEHHKDKIEVFFLPPHAPEYNPDEYLNHALKISVYSGQLPYTREDLCHKIQSFMRKLQHRLSLVSSFFFHPTLSYLYVRKQYPGQGFPADYPSHGDVPR